MVGTIGHLTGSQLSVTLLRRPHEINSIVTFDQYGLVLKDIHIYPIHWDFGLSVKLRLALNRESSHIPPSNVSLPSTINSLTLMSRANDAKQIYKGRNEIRLSKLVTEPSHSILTQSYDSRLRLVCVPHPTGQSAMWHPVWN